MTNLFLTTKELLINSRHTAKLDTIAMYWYSVASAGY